MSQRTQAPSGLGYLLENRLIISRLFPEAFRDLKVQRLAATYRALVEGLRSMCPAEGEPRIVLLTPGPYNETYFEHAYLARYLGLTLVEGSDLTVRDQRLYFKTLQGLEPVHGILKRLDDEFLDPLELRSDSHLGVPGLLQVDPGRQRAGGQRTGLRLSGVDGVARLPAGARRAICWARNCKLPSLATWWCGERAALEAVLPQLATSVIKPTYSGGRRRRGAGQVAVAPRTRRVGRPHRARSRRTHDPGLAAAVADADLEAAVRTATASCRARSCCASSPCPTGRSPGGCCRAA